jgi:hypothetical protein
MYRVGEADVLTPRFSERLVTSRQRGSRRYISRNRHASSVFQRVFTRPRPEAVMRSAE